MKSVFCLTIDKNLELKNHIYVPEAHVFDEKSSALSYIYDNVKEDDEEEDDAHGSPVRRRKEKLIRLIEATSSYLIPITHIKETTQNDIIFEDATANIKYTLKELSIMEQFDSSSSKKEVSQSVSGERRLSTVAKRRSTATSLPLTPVISKMIGQVVYILRISSEDFDNLVVACSYSEKGAQDLASFYTSSTTSSPVNKTLIEKQLVM